MADEQLPKSPYRYVGYPDPNAQKAASDALQSAADALLSAKSAIDNANLATQAAASAYLESVSAMNEFAGLQNPSKFVTATLINGFTATRPVKYASLLAQTTRYVGEAKTTTAKTAGTRLFQLQQVYWPKEVTPLSVTVKDLPKGGVTLNLLTILGVSITPTIKDGMTTGQTLLNIGTDGWLTLQSDIPAGCTIVFDGATNVKSTS